MIDVKKLKIDALDIDILYVDSHAALLKNASTLLKKFFNTVHTAGDGLSGLELFKHYNPQIVVTDINIQTVNGVELAQEINTISPKTKIIIMSAENDNTSLSRFKKTGNFKFLKKPVNVGNFIETIFSALQEIKSEKNKRFFEEKLKTALTNKSSLAVMLDQHKPVLANNAFLDFFDSKSVDEFNEKHDDLSSLFLEQDGFLYNKNNKNSLDSINSKDIYNVKIEDNKGNPNHFILKYKRVPNDEIHSILSLENITALNLMHLYNEKLDSNKKDKETKDRINLLEVLKRNGANVQLHNYYKGLSITNNALILDVSDSHIVLKTNEMQLKAVKYERRTIIVSDTLPYSMLCQEIEQIYFSNQKITFKEFRFIPTSPITRKSIRIEPDGQYCVFLSINDHLYKGEIAIEDISLDAVKLNLDAFPAGIKRDDHKIDLEIILAKDSEPIVLKANAKYFRDDEHKDSYSIVFMLKFEPNQKSNLVKYIAKRQMALIREFKGL